MNATLPKPRSIRVSDETIQAYRRDGFVKIEGIITKEEAACYYEEALRIAKKNSAEKKAASAYRKVLNQTVNAWEQSEIMKALTFHPNVSAVAKQLAGVPLLAYSIAAGRDCPLVSRCFLST